MDRPLDGRAVEKFVYCLQEKVQKYNYRNIKDWRSYYVTILKVPNDIREGIVMVMMNQ